MEPKELHARARDLNELHILVLISFSNINAESKVKLIKNKRKRKGVLNLVPDRIKVLL